jgi:hypothetical protein
MTIEMARLSIDEQRKLNEMIEHDKKEHDVLMKHNLERGGNNSFPPSTIIGFTKSGAVVKEEAMGYQGREGDGYFIYKKEGGGRRASFLSLDKIVVKKVNSEFWSRWSKQKEYMVRWNNE